MCEVGEKKIDLQLSGEKMLQVADEVISAWKHAATEDIKLRHMFTAGAPYVTIYIDGPIRCSNHRILHSLYHAGGEPRTSQTFLCSLPCGESIDVVNVHAPSGKIIARQTTKGAPSEADTEQFAKRKHWKRPLLDWRRHVHNSSPDVSVVAEVSRQWLAAHEGANS